MTVLGACTDTVAMVQEFSAKLVGSCDAAEFAKKSQAGTSLGGGMPGGAMPSFDPSALPSRRSTTDAAPSASAAKAADVTAAKEAPKDATTKTMAAGKKALGDLLSF